MKYTFTFDHEEEAKFRRVVDRLDPEEYTVLEEIHLTKPEDGKHSPRETIMEMEPEAALTFRLGMKNVKIRRERTEEELAEEKALKDANTIKVTVLVDPSQMPGAAPSKPAP